MTQVTTRISLIVLLALGAAGWLSSSTAEAQNKTAPQPGLLLPTVERSPSSSGVLKLIPPGATGDGALRPITVEFTGQTPSSYYASGPELRERSLFGQVYDTFAYSMQYIWDTLTTGLTPPSPTSFAKTFDEKDPNSFWYMISETGYKLKEIETDVSIIPNVGFKFKYVRQLSDADINYMERKLERHAKKFSDIGSKLQRSILATLLDINNSDSYYVETVTVKLLPIPRATFALQPWEGGLPRELDVLLRAIQGKENPYAHSPHGGGED